MSELDLTALLRALAASEAGSFAGAARRLGISRQGLHRSVEALETQLGAPIFDRGRTGLRPTAMGRALLGQAARLREVEQAVRGTVAHLGAAPAGLIRLATPPLFGDAVLGSALQRCARQWPGLRFEVRSESRRTDLIADDYDLMIRVGAPPPDGHFARLLGHASLVLCGAPSYVAQVGALSDPAHLTTCALLEYGPRRSTEWGFSRGPAATTVAVDVLLAADAATLVVDAALAGLGLLRVPELAVRAHLISGALVPVLTGWELPRAEVWAIYGHRSAADPALAALLDELRRSLAAA